MTTTDTDLLLIETLATTDIAALARIEFAATRAYGATLPFIVAFRRHRLVGLDDQRRLVYAWRALVHDAAPRSATPDPDPSPTTHPVAARAKAGVSPA